MFTIYWPVVLFVYGDYAEAIFFPQKQHKFNPLIPAIAIIMAQGFQR